MATKAYLCDNDRVAAAARTIYHPPEPLEQVGIFNDLDA